MRTFLDSVFDFLGLESLTDEEWNLVDTQLTGKVADFNIDTYKACDDILIFREENSAMRKRLSDLYSAKGIDVNPSPTPIARSNIYIGDALE